MPRLAQDVANPVALKAFVKAHSVQLSPGESKKARTFVGSMRTYTFPLADFRGQPRKTVVHGCLRCGILICGS